MSIFKLRKVSWNRPLVSALMITKNRGPMAKRNICSLLDQTWPWKEIIVIDDSEKKQQLHSDPRVKHVWLSEPTPIWTKHDMAVQYAQGNVFVYWDDDDWFSSKKIAKQMQPVLDDKADMVGLKRRFIYRITDHTWWEFTRLPPKDRSWLGNGLGAAGFKFHDGTCLFTRKACAKLKHGERQVSQKLMMIYSMWKRGERLVILPEQDLFVYVRHGTNTWQFDEDVRMISVERPKFIPQSRMDFWISGAWNVGA